MRTAFYDEKRLELTNIKGIMLQAAFVATAIFVPRIVHFFGGMNAGQILLPMHWMVFISAMVFGWRGGLVSAIAIPAISFLYSHMPVSFVMPAIYMELLVYGLVFGVLREKVKINIYILLFAALITGRLFFFAGIKITQLFIVFPGFLSVYSKGFIEFAGLYFTKGIISGILQLILVPAISLFFIKNIDKK